MRVAAGSDHAGFNLTEILTAELAAEGHDVRLEKLAGLARGLVDQIRVEGSP